MTGCKTIPKKGAARKMKTAIGKTCVAFALTSINILCFAHESGADGGKEYANPGRFDKAIESFEAADRDQPAAQGAIVFIGSSSMRGWHKTIHNDLAPLNIIARGFGGSNMNDALHYTNRIVLPYKPRAVVVYEGDNDVAQGISPQKITDTFQAFVDKIHAELPECRIYFLSIKPSIRRWQLWPRMQEVNELIAKKCNEDNRLTYVDVASGMLNEQGEPRKDIFKADDLHMNDGGYVIWRDALRPILLQSELQYQE